MMKEKLKLLISTLLDSKFEDEYEFEEGLLLFYMLHPKLIDHLSIHTELYDGMADNSQRMKYSDEFLDIKFSVATEMFEKGKITYKSFEFLDHYTFLINQIYNRTLGTFLIEDPIIESNDI